MTPPLVTIKKRQRIRAELWPLLIHRNQDLGGVVVLATGNLGSGKTCWLVHTAARLLEEKAKLLKQADLSPAKRLVAEELLFWRGDVSAQWRKLPAPFECKVFVLEGLELKFYRNGVQFEMPLTRFKDFAELVKLADPAKLNVVYLDTPLDHAKFFRFLVASPATSWTSFFMDEVEDVCPSYLTGEAWQNIRRFTDSVKTSRKRKVSLYAASQSRSDLDFRFLAKVKFNVLLPGALTVHGSLVWQKSLASLRIGSYWITTGGLYDKLSFPPYISYDDVVVEGLSEMHYTTKPETSSTDAPQDL
jgi:hypothetical protein